MNDSAYLELQKAKELVNKRNLQDSLLLLRKLEKENPNEIGIKFELGKCLLKTKLSRNEGKRRLLEILPYADNKYRECIILELGKIEEKEGNFDKAREYFKSLPYDKFALFELGKLETKLGNLNEAKEILLSIKDDIYIYYELGKVEVRLGNYDKAREYFNYNRNSSYSACELGKLEISLGNYEEAEKIFLSFPNNDYVKLELVFLYTKLGRFSEALDIFNNISIEHFCFKKWDFISRYLNHMLGIKSINESNINSYFEKQFYSYSESDAIRHIKLGYDEYGDKRKYNLFASDDIESLFYEVQSKVSESIPNRSAIVDKYNIECDSVISVNNGGETKFVRVITLPNTSDIIAMYPLNKHSMDEAYKLTLK